MIIDDNTIQINDEKVFRSVFETALGLCGIQTQTFKSMVGLMGVREGRA